MPKFKLLISETKKQKIYDNYAIRVEDCYIKKTNEYWRTVI